MDLRAAARHLPAGSRLNEMPVMDVSCLANIVAGPAEDLDA